MKRPREHYVCAVFGLLTLYYGTSIMRSMEERENNLRFCRKCLTRELADQEEVYGTIRDYIENLDPDLKADKEIYEKRLGICKECEMLLQGMCRSCGCYVEMRAAMVKNSCPGKRW